MLTKDTILYRKSFAFAIRTEFITEQARSSLHKDADELSKVLFSILRTTRLKSSST
jgi:hypothetical protein